MRSFSDKAIVWIDDRWIAQPDGKKRCIRCKKKLTDDDLVCISPNGRVCWEFTKTIKRDSYDD